ncbi:MAG: DUF4382 domain-containing protein [Nevskiaceae bacterium]
MTLLFLLSGCEAQLTVDLTDGPVDSADEVVLDITHVALLTADNDVVRLALDAPGPVDLLLFRKGETYRLVSGEDLENDRYVGIALDFASGGSFVTRDDGAEITINTPTTRDFAAIDLTIEDLDEERLVLDLNLRFSLVDDGSGSYDLEPVWRAARPGDAGEAGGAVATALVESDGCRAGRPAGEGVAVYVFRGSDVTPGDYVGQANLIDAAAVELDTTTSEYRYSLHFLPADDYTLALTCQADADDPTTDDAVTFDASANVTVTEGGSATMDFL